MHRRLTRSTKNALIAGVCGGLAEYLGWSPFRVRLVYVVDPFSAPPFPASSFI